MTQKEKQLLHKDLCARLLYGVKFTLSGDCIYTMKGIDLIVTDEGDWEYAVTAKGITPIEIKYIKPYLRPMSSMTEEEKEEFENLVFTYDFGNGQFPIEHVIMYWDSFEEVLEWLNSHHFDYRGLIPMGLALEAPEDMYKTV